MVAVSPSAKRTCRNTYAALAEFRHRLREFLAFSEEAAQAAGLHPQQHQMMLAIAGAPAGTSTTVAYVAERLGVKHNSAVELANRCVAEGLLRRVADKSDGRRILLKLTPQGMVRLKRLTRSHAKELDVLAPQLITSLRAISMPAAKAAR
jgi:DNA-binding MarR family transcriptional regulator